MGIIVYNGISCKDYGIQVESPPGYDYPEKDIETIQVPGRNGGIIIDRGAYKNVNRPYKISFGEIDGNFTELASGVSKWLHSAPNYSRLEDTYEPDYYRMATYSEGGSIENILQQAGRTTISFNCKPERFLKSGEHVITIGSSPQTIDNPTKYISLPIINVKGSGDGILNVGEYKVTITNIINSITINSEIEDAYNGLINLNMYIVLNNTFPKLVPGDNLISFSGGITSVEIIPRWWTI